MPTRPPRLQLRRPRRAHVRRRPSASARGYPIQNPYLSVANRAMSQMQKLLVEFGMTPSSRSRIKVDGQGAEDELTAFLNNQ